MAVTVDSIPGEGIEGDWGDLLPSCWTNTVFLTTWWQTTWLKHFGDETKTRLIRVRDDNGKLVGMAPMNIAGGAVTFMGDTDLFDYRDFLVSRGAEDTFYPAVFDEIDTWEWDTLDQRWRALPLPRTAGRGTFP